MTSDKGDLTILRWLASRDHAAAPQIATACRLKSENLRARLVHLESMRYIVGRLDKGTTPPRHVFYVTGEGKRAAGLEALNSARPPCRAF